MNEFNKIHFGRQNKSIYSMTFNYSDVKKYFLLTLFIGLLFTTAANAFSPPPPDQEKVQLCKSTNGTVNITHEGGYDPKTGIDWAWATFVNCNCPEGFGWNATTGCIKAESVPIQKRYNTTPSLEIGVFIILIFLIIFSRKLRKK